MFNLLSGERVDGNPTGISSKDDFLRVLDRAIKPPDQENQRTLEKTDSCDCNEKHTHSNNSEDNQRTPS